jgi:hypothetical protein
MNDFALSLVLVAEMWDLKIPHRLERQDKGFVGPASSAFRSQLVP